jgi:hypothetical protein
MEFTEPNVDFEIYNCETSAIVTVTISAPYYLCSGTVPIPLSPVTGLTMTLVDPTAYQCLGSLRCAQVIAPCGCWSIYLEVEETATGSCGGTIVSVTNTTPSAGTFFLCSTSQPTGGSAHTLINPNCVKPCGEV